MTLFQKVAACSVAISVLFATTSVACAQQSRTTNRTRPPRKTPTPKAAAEKKPQPAPKPHHTPTLLSAAPRPAAPPPPAPATPSSKSAVPAEQPTELVQPLLETDPAVRFALEMPRKEPRDYVQSILLLVDLGRPELAKPILAELMKLNVTDAQRVAIVNEFGSQGMLHLSRAKELAPAAGSFADACMAAANAAATNPERIAALVKQLSDPSPEVRMVARNDLAATGQAGATAALEALARESDPQRRAAIAAAVELMHPLVDRPLLAMLETRDPQLRTRLLLSSNNSRCRKPPRYWPAMQSPPSEPLLPPFLTTSMARHLSP